MTSQPLPPLRPMKVRDLDGVVHDLFSMGTSMCDRQFQTDARFNIPGIDWNNLACETLASIEMTTCLLCVVRTTTLNVLRREWARART